MHDACMHKYYDMCRTDDSTSQMTVVQNLKLVYSSLIHPETHHPGDSAVHVVPTRCVLSLRRSNFGGLVKQGGALALLSIRPIDPGIRRTRCTSAGTQWPEKQAVRLPAGCILVVK